MERRRGGALVLGMMVLEMVLRRGTAASAAMSCSRLGSTDFVRGRSSGCAVALAVAVAGAVAVAR